MTNIYPFQQSFITLKIEIISKNKASNFSAAGFYLP